MAGRPPNRRAWDEPVKSPSWTPQEKKVALFTAACAVVGLVALGTRWKPEPKKQPAQTVLPTPTMNLFTRRPVPTMPVARKVLDLNLATERELGGSPGMSPSIAHAVVAYRATHGAFHSVAEIRSLQAGISPERLAFIEQYVQVRPHSQPIDRETPR